MGIMWTMSPFDKWNWYKAQNLGYLGLIKQRAEIAWAKVDKLTWRNNELWLCVSCITQLSVPAGRTERRRYNDIRKEHVGAMHVGAQHDMAVDIGEPTQYPNQYSTQNTLHGDEM